MQDRLLTIDEVANYLGVSPNTVRAKEFRDRVGLHAIRVGRRLRISKKSFDDFINAHTERPKGPPDHRLVL